jgi:hypothetical protein
MTIRVGKVYTNNLQLTFFHYRHNENPTDPNSFLKNSWSNIPIHNNFLIIDIEPIIISTNNGVNATKLNEYKVLYQNKIYYLYFNCDEANWLIA